MIVGGFNFDKDCSIGTFKDQGDCGSRQEVRSEIGQRAKNRAEH